MFSLCQRASASRGFREFLPGGRLFKDVSDIDGARLGSTVKSGLRGNKILAGVEIDRITSGIDPDR